MRGQLHAPKKRAYHVADEERPGRVAVEAVKVHGDVDVYDIPVLQRPAAARRAPQLSVPYEERKRERLNSSGIPCVMTWFTRVQHDFGKPL